MARIEDVVETFIKTRGSRDQKASSVTTVHRKLYSYDTLIAEFADSNLILNITKYSMTTSRLQNRIRRIALVNDINLVEVSNQPFNVQKLSN